MAKKFKCDDCHTEHGGFHLCLGVIELPPRKSAGFRTYQEKSLEIQARRTAEAAAKYEAALEAYDHGEPVKSIVRRFNLNRGTFRKHITKHNAKKEHVA